MKICARRYATLAIWIIISWLQSSASFAQPVAGCVGNGIANDTACIQAAINSGVVNLGKYVYAIGPTGLQCNNPTSITGTQGNQSANYGTFSGFRPIQPNTTILTLNNGCTGSILSRFSVDMGAAGTNTTGVAIAMPAAVNNITIQDVAINAPCIGIDLNGNTIKLDRVQITQVSGSGCGGIRVGNATQGAITADTRITNSTIQSVQVGSGKTPGSWGMLIKDSGGLFAETNDILFFDVGTWIFPGVNQAVVFSFFSNTIFGDTTVNSPLVIDTAAASAIVKSFRAVNSWAAAFTSTTAAPGIMIRNSSNSAVFSGFQFVGQRIVSVPGNGVSLMAGTDFSFDSSTICGVGLNTSADFVGIELAANLSGLAIRNSKISYLCEGSTPGRNAYQVKLNTNNSNIIIQGNNFYGWRFGAISGTPVQGGVTGSNIITNNLGVDDQTPSLIAAATVSPGTYPIINVSGSSTITTIDGCWAGRSLLIRPATNLTFSTGGNIAAPYAATANVPVIATCVGTSPPYWFLK
jgi:hypothetical protein